MSCRLFHNPIFSNCVSSHVAQGISNTLKSWLEAGASQMPAPVLHSLPGQLDRFFLIPTFSIIFIYQVNLNNASHSWWTFWVMSWCCSSANCLPKSGFQPEHQINTHAYISSTQEVKAWRSETEISLTLTGPAWAKEARPCLKQKIRSKETNNNNSKKKKSLSSYGFPFSFV